ncbi:MAG: virulence RhuM family protein [Bifidobacteriaceae bacterium]|jgi:hypothetical protein|nr:virulence RhuM family protein [Bifidobacteriaceae bacterium]
MGEQSGEVIIYRREGASEVQLRPAKGTVWLTYEQMADLYATSRENIVQIVRRVLADEELDRSTCNSELQVRQEGKRPVRREVSLFNLDMALAVGYRVTTRQAVLFRQWATTVLKEYLVKGFAMDDERLKNPARFSLFPAQARHHAETRTEPAPACSARHPARAGELGSSRRGQLSVGGGTMVGDRLKEER